MPCTHAGALKLDAAHLALLHVEQCLSNLVAHLLHCCRIKCLVQQVHCARHYLAEVARRKSDIHVVIHLTLQIYDKNQGIVLFPMG